MDQIGAGGKLRQVHATETHGIIGADIAGDLAVEPVRTRLHSPFHFAAGPRDGQVVGDPKFGAAPRSIRR